MNPNPDSAIDFLVDRRDWRTGRVVHGPAPGDPGAGRAVLRVDRFALTSNNVSYALMGDLLKYWSFFPAPDGWGRIPAMGFADVIASGHPGVRVGERVFGFLPMSTHLVVEVAEPGPTSFLDGAAHRRDTALAYRQYLRSTADPQYDPAREDVTLLLRGLFLTSFLVDDFLADNGDFGSRAFVVSSASSKTAIALARCLSRRHAGRVVGLTSGRNRAFVAGLGCYDEVLAYDEVERLDAAAPTVFVDHSGDGAVVGAIHERLGDSLRHSAVVGATHWGAKRPRRNLPGPVPAFFFAPSQIEKRTAEWGAAGFQTKLGDAWRDFVGFSDGWLRIVRRHGPAEVERVYREIVDGQARPEQGHILSMWERAG